MDVARADTLLDLTDTVLPRTDSTAITDAIVRILRAHTGRGPTAATTVVAPDLAVVTLSDCLTKGETLARLGHSDAALRLRAALHDEIRDEAVATVEAISGRRVAAYLAAQEHDPDIAILAFYFGR